MSATRGHSPKNILTVKNNCTVDNKPVALRNLEVKAEWKGNPIGSIAMDKDEGAIFVQQAYYGTILPTLKAEQEATIPIHIIPLDGSINGSAKLKIFLRGSFLTEKGLQFVNAETEYIVNIVNVSGCVSFSFPKNEANFLTIEKNSTSQFKIINNCPTDITFKLIPKPDNFINYRPRIINIKPGKSGIIKAESKMSPVGVYLLELQQKIKGERFKNLKVGKSAFRIFVSPAKEDCLVLDNYEYSFENTNERFGYLINRCYQVNLKMPYRLKLGRGSLNWANMIVNSLGAGAGGAISSIIQNTHK